MARPSNKEEKAELILDAFERCIAKYGVEGTTLKLVAEEASMARALLRHHVGNREELIDAVVRRFIDRSAALNQELLSYLPEKKRVPMLLSLLFAAENLDYTNDILVAEALMNAAQTRPELARQLRQWYVDFENIVIDELRQAYSIAPMGDVRAVATGVVGIYFSVYSIAGLGQAEQMLRQSRCACEKLIGTLG